jgi:hypothetical protein
MQQIVDLCHESEVLVRVQSSSGFTGTRRKGIIPSSSGTELEDRERNGEGI